MEGLWMYFCSEDYKVSILSDLKPSMLGTLVFVSHRPEDRSNASPRDRLVTADTIPGLLLGEYGATACPLHFCT